MRFHPSPSRFSILTLLVALAMVAGAIPATAHPSEDTVDDDEWFHDLLTGPSAPTQSPSFRMFPQHSEVMSRVDALEDDPWMTVHSLGESNEGKAVRLVEVVDPNSTVPVEDRVVTFFLTQQHGNEPAGTPAALDLLEEIQAGGKIRETLENQVLLVLPMANPDGGDAGTRANAKGADTNRDHNDMETPEARAMHQVLNDWEVHVALDHHEYGGTGLGYPFPVRIYDYDLTTLYPTHGSVDEGVLSMAKDLMYDGIWPRAEEEGYSVNEYGEQTVAGEPTDHVAGGADPGILRNHNGLHHTAGILIETRVDADDNPFHDAERRSSIQHLTMVSTLEYVHENAQHFINARADAIERNLEDPPEYYQEGDDDNPFTGDSDPVAMPEAFRIDGDVERTLDLFEHHGLPAGVVDGDAVVHNMDHGWLIHSAALLMDESSRQVLDGEPTDPIVVAAEGDDAGAAEAAPAVPVIVFVLLLVAFVASRDRLRRGSD